MEATQADRDKILQDYEEALDVSAKHHEANIKEAKEHCLQRLKELRQTETES